MFINKDILFSILEITELQWEVYKNFLKLTGDEKEARIQTEIYMTSMHNAARRKSGEEGEPS